MKTEQPSPETATSRQENELKPCPFCGSATNLVIRKSMSHPEFTVVVCTIDLDGCGSSTAWWETEADAIAAWNRRAKA